MAHVHHQSQIGGYGVRGYFGSAGANFLLRGAGKHNLRFVAQALQTLDDASAAARVALPLAVPHSPHAAMLQALAAVHPTLMTAPEERRLYLLRGADGVARVEPLG